MKPYQSAAEKGSSKSRNWLKPTWLPLPDKHDLIKANANCDLCEMKQDDFLSSMETMWALASSMRDYSFFTMCGSSQALPNIFSECLPVFPLNCIAQWHHDNLSLMKYTYLRLGCYSWDKISLCSLDDLVLTDPLSHLQTGTPASLDLNQTPKS